MPRSARSLFTRPPQARMSEIRARLSRQPANATALAAALEVSPKTVRRDIAFLRDRLAQPIAFDPAANVYRYTGPAPELPGVEMTEGELFALLIAQRALVAYRETPYHRQLSAAFEKLAAVLRDRITFRPADVTAGFSFAGLHPARVDPEVFLAVSSALTRGVEITFRYRKPGAAPESRRIRPYHLTQRGGAWYLLAHDVVRQARRRFALQRMSEVAATRVHFRRPADFRPEQDYRGSFGVWVGSGDYAVRIRFAAAVADLVREREWHATQVFSAGPADTLDLALRLDSLDEVASWILGWGGAARALAPAALVDRVRFIAQACASAHAPR